MSAVIQVEHLRKVYGPVIAVDALSFEVEQGEIFGMVGPNGAGKTSTVECIEGLRAASGGTIRVLGMDPQSEKYRVRPHIGVQLQESALQARLKVWEALDLFASFYARSVNQVALLEQVGLTEKRNARFAKLSGGQKQRLFIALALVHDPEIVFLDELTTGLDPQARRAMWEMVRGMRERGKTVFLITHSMEEAERLCDRVAIVDQGRIVALDSPHHLVSNLGADNRVVFTVDGMPDLQCLQALQEVSDIQQVEDRLVISGKGDGDALLSSVVTALPASGIRYHDLHTERPTLEDVFLKVTGRRALCQIRVSRPSWARCSSSSCSTSQARRYHSRFTRRRCSRLPSLFH
ncbi:MAG TPA: ABC transporter ATP-binding protein [Ktedonobacteraceae bacterium]|nr:ABC transporter ATP-binding protein [Ktedonobacteraceae bacterium]